MNSFAKKTKDNGLPIGVYKNLYSYGARGAKNNGNQYLGSFATVEEAELAQQENYLLRLDETERKVKEERETTLNRIAELKGVK
jgi:hypothetical protein